MLSHFSQEHTRLLCPRDFLGKNTGVCYHALLQGIFPIQGLNPLSLMSPAFSGRFFVTNAIREALNGHEFEQTPRDGEGQGSLTCCSPWGCKESDTTEQLNNNKTVPTPAPVRGLQKSAYFLERK